MSNLATFIAASFIYLCVCVYVHVLHFLPTLHSHKFRFHQQINTGIDGRQIKTIMATRSNSSAKLISF